MMIKLPVTCCNFKIPLHVKSLSIIILAAISACTHSGNELEPGLLLTFDDRNMLNWEKQIPLFEKYDAHVTFFIDRFDELSEDQIGALHNLKNAGHAIGCHGLRHRKAAEYSKNNPAGQYISEEIIPAIEIMKEKGFPPSSFAYPSSNHNEDTDRELLKYFRYLRSGCGIEGEIEKTEKAFVRISDGITQRRFDGISFHPKSKNDDLVIQARKALDRIKKNRELLVLYAHDIRNLNEDGPKHYITVEALEEILSYAKSNNIRLYSFDELP